MKFVPSALGMGSPSGSQGSTVASHNRFGYYTRNRVVPTNPNTTRQQLVRSLFGSMVESWTMLSAAVREGWNAYAANVPVTDPLGQQINLTGQNWYIGNNTARVQAGLAGVTNAPIIFDIGEPVTGITLQSIVGVNVIGLDDTQQLMSNNVDLAIPASDDGDILIYLGKPVNASRTFYKGPYQLAATIPIAATDVSVIWSTAVGDLLNEVPPVLGQTRGIRFRVAYDDGRLSQPFDLLTTVVDDPV